MAQNSSQTITKKDLAPLKEAISKSGRETKRLRQASVSLKKSVAENGKGIKQLRGEIKKNRVEISRLWVETTAIRQEIKTFKSLLIEFRDEIMGELKGIRQELAASLEQYRRSSETLKDHEERITTLENPKFA